MNQRLRLVALVLALTATSAIVAAQQRGNAPPNDNAILALLARTNKDAQQFDRTIDLALGRNPARPVNPSQIENDVDQLVNELMDTTAHLRDHFVRREVINADVEDVLIRGAKVDQFIRRNQMSANVEQSWQTVRRDLDELARAFNVEWNWTSPRMAPAPGPPYYDRLSGTYQLDRVRSDDAQRIAVQAARGVPSSQRTRVEQDLISRLDPPEFISVDRNGRTVSIASSRTPRGTFEIDGRPRTEPNGFGGMSTVRASFYGDELMVTTTGNRGQDFAVTFEPMNGGETLRVNRSLDVMGLTSPVQADSFYRRTSPQADWNLYEPPPPPPPPPPSVSLVPSGTVLVGQLNVSLSTRSSRPGSRFSLTIDGPSQFRGAVIDGVVARVNGSGRPGRNELILDFDRIRMRDGRTSPFVGTLSQVRTPNGRLILVDTEGVALGAPGRSSEVVQGGAVGAAFGALIGAIVAGGKGAAVGAVVGAGAGAGTVYVEGIDLDLPRGTEVQVIAQPTWGRRG